MIVVWSCHDSSVAAFKDLEAYQAFAREHEGKDRTCWDDSVHDVGEGGEATEENKIEMLEFNCECSGC